ncbi:McrB family protein [Ruminococcus sp.]
MGKITWNSTFKDVQELLINEDETFVKQLEYLNSDQFQKATDSGYLRRNLHFFMAIVLQGVQSPKSKKYIENFLYILYPNPTSIGTKLGTWRQNAGRFVEGSDAKSIDTDLNNQLKEIPANTTLMDVFRNGAWVNFKDSSGKPIFWDANNKSIFIYGEDDAKQKMKQIADFLINGTQITSDGGFSLMVDTYSLLKANKQLILNGAPGTGKTFSARNEIADKLLGKNADKNIQMEMVQFHPSYDYTDFIEGIRPNLASESIGYTLKNGSFKSFCRKAGVIERIKASGKNVTEGNIKEFLKGEDKSIVDFWINKINEEGFDTENIKPADLPPFLFIIDEINRAEISKVLGETMFCLDADYRGANGKIATQYSALATDETFYINEDNDKFFIPSNVYIIGTMNDIDRSVEVFDFALRRRFAWHEVTAEAVMDKVLKEMGVDNALGNDYNNYVSKITALNKSIDNTLKLNRHYHLGPSYFAKILLYLDGNNYQEARKEVWDNHLSQILNEYVKGKRTESEVAKIGDDFTA